MTTRYMALAITHALSYTGPVLLGQLIAIGVVIGVVLILSLGDRK